MEPQEIFVVDDDASVRKAVKRLLLPVHLPVRAFASAEQFLAAIKSNARGCLIADLRLPGMSGVELLEHLVGRQWNLPTIIMTAHDDNRAQDAALRMGVVAYLRKPFDQGEFLSSVRAAVARNVP